MEYFKTIVTIRIQPNRLCSLKCVLNITVYSAYNVCPDCYIMISFNWLNGVTPPNVFTCPVADNVMLHLTT